MPTILRSDGFRFFFYSAESGEPPHIHISHSGRTAKYWLEPVELASSDGFRSHELARVRDLILEHREALRSAWHEQHGNPGSIGFDRS